MLVRILGAAAGGGFPQWNCHCNGCETNRGGKAESLTQSSIAIRAASGDWFLINASPDVRSQIESMRAEGCFEEVFLEREKQNQENPNHKTRSLPFAGIILTDAEIDHTTGLILLRESSQPLKIYSPASVKYALTTGYPLLNTLQNYCGVEWFDLDGENQSQKNPDAKNQITSDLEISAFPLSSKPPKYMQDSNNLNNQNNQTWGIGLTIRDRMTGGVLTYAPGLGAIDTAMEQRLAASDCILVDGTFWTNDELPALGIGSRTALQMGHLPLSGEDGSLQKLAHIQEKSIQEKSIQEKSIQENSIQENSNQENSNQEKSIQENSNQEKSIQENSNQENSNQENSNQENSTKTKNTRQRQILVHINNTNPILIPDSKERKTVIDRGVEIGYDGLMFEI